MLLKGQTGICLGRVKFCGENYPSCICVLYYLVISLRENLICDEKISEKNCYFENRLLCSANILVSLAL